MPTAVHRPKPKQHAGEPRHAHAHPKDGGFFRSLWARKVTRIVAIAVSVLIAIPVLFVLGIVLGINPIVRMGVERLGTDALKVPVQLQRASISFGGQASLQHFSIANPDGFRRWEACSFDALYAAVPIRSAFREEIDIPELTIQHPEFAFELGGKHQPSNWGVLMKNLSQSLPKKGEAPKPDHEKTFRIEKLKIIGPVVHFRTASMDEPLTLHLKDIELQNIGTAPGTRSKTYVVLAAIFQALLTGGIKEGKDLPSDVSGPLAKELSEATKDFGEVLKASQ